MASPSRRKSAAAPAANLTLVAREAGVSVMTVSNVLRGKGRFSAATKDRVLKAAEVVGYQADPLVSRLMSRIRTPCEKRAQATIALLGPWSPDHDEAKEGYFARLVAGARARAAEKGFGCDRVITGRGGLAGAQLNKVLKARGIECVLVTPWSVPGGHFQFDWSPFAVVGASSALWRPTLHRATPAHYLNAEKALHKIRRSGYRRPGLVVDTMTERLANHAWSACFLEYARRHPEMAPVPILSGKSITPVSLHGWFLRERPDVILSPQGDKVLKMLRKLGVRLPQDAGLVHIGGYKPDPSIALIDQQPARIGAAAVDLLVSMFYTGERGLPANPLQILVEGTLLDGPTLPQCQRGEPLRRR
jgi:DNA-binding LacI/PurR family transcriptional regulator